MLNTKNAIIFFFDIFNQKPNTFYIVSKTAAKYLNFQKMKQILHKIEEKFINLLDEKQMVLSAQQFAGHQPGQWSSAAYCRTAFQWHFIHSTIGLCQCCPVG